MNKFRVKFNTRSLLNKWGDVVIADKFTKDLMTRTITFTDEDGKNVAMYKLNNIESINKVHGEEEVTE